MEEKARGEEGKAEGEEEGDRLWIKRLTSHINTIDNLCLLLKFGQANGFAVENGIYIWRDVVCPQAILKKSKEIAICGAGI